MVAAAREVALDVLVAVHSREAYANLALDSELSKQALSQRDAALATEIAYGTLRAQGTLDWVLDRFSTRRLAELSPALLDILRLAAYQILYLDVPDHAAVNEAVDQARGRLHRGVASYANAVLRSLLRGRESIAWPSRERDFEAHLSLVRWHPAWLVRKWVSELGPKLAEELCEADNAPPALTLRVNATRASRDEVLEALRGRGVEAEPGRWMGEAIRLKRAGALDDLPEYQAGTVYAQDEASMAVAHAVDPKPGETVADLCAAPGGKAAHLSELMGGAGSVLAVDINASRLRLVSQTVGRLHEAGVRTVQADATQWRPEEKVTRVLLDAPCSGLGVLRRRAELRWRRRPEDIPKLVELQRRLLENAAAILAPGGVLVYSTCAISKPENQDQVEGFLSAHAEFEPGDPSGDLGIESPLAGPGWLQFLPNVHDTDGIFVAKMVKLAKATRRK
ncbi:MAG: 16S rRNA (cytosine(967)-C(5))-methyltransferase RsmB [Actinobacteria bacterium]|nr:MAG: 16S rRNA (cytosine(967)-C(5))-methyltransferase RsmB [Actinomycetota bacterium]